MVLNRFVTRLVCWSVLLAPFSLVNQLAAQSANEGTGSRVERMNAVQNIPWKKIQPTLAREIQQIVHKPSVYRRLPLQTIDCDPTFFLFLIRNPEVVVNIWRVMGVTELTIDRRGDFTFGSSDGMGTVSQTELVYGSPNTHVFVGRGYYEGPLLKRRIAGKCVVLLRTQYEKSPQGRTRVRNRLDFFLDMEQNAVDVFARTFQPMIGRAADLNFTETGKFLAHLSRTAELDSNGMFHLASRLNDLQPQVRKQFIEVATTVEKRRTSPTRERGNHNSKLRTEHVGYNEREIRKSDRAPKRVSLASGTVPRRGTRPQSPNPRQPRSQRSATLVSRLEAADAARWR